MTILADHITALQTRGRDTVVALDLVSHDLVTAANLYIIALDEILRLQNERKAMLTRLARQRLPQESSAVIAGMTLKDWRAFEKATIT